MTKLTNNLKLRSSIRLLRYAASELRDVKLQVAELEKDIQLAVSFAKKNLGHNDEKKLQKPQSEGDEKVKTTDPVKQGKPRGNEREEYSNLNNDDTAENDPGNEKESVEKLSIEPEYKKLFKKIAKKTHPDKVLNSNDIDQYEKDVLVAIFKDAKSAMENTSRNLLLSAGCEANVDLLDVGFDHGELSERLKKQSDSISDQLNKAMNSHVWSWGQEESIEVKIKILRAYMQYSGLSDLSDVFLRDVIESYSSSGRPKRKIGTRPKKIKRY